MLDLGRGSLIKFSIRLLEVDLKALGDDVQIPRTFPGKKFCLIQKWLSGEASEMTFIGNPVLQVGAGLI